MQQQRQEADHRVRPDALRQPVVDGRDLQIALENAEAALDISQGDILDALTDLARKLRRLYVQLLGVSLFAL